MAPGIGLAISIGIGVQFAGANLPLAVLITLVACAFTAIAPGQLASRIPVSRRALPRAGGPSCRVAPCPHPKRCRRLPRAPGGTGRADA
jgi:hypothetical protein